MQCAVEWVRIGTHKCAWQSHKFTGLAHIRDILLQFATWEYIQWHRQHHQVNCFKFHCEWPFWTVQISMHVLQSQLSPIHETIAYQDSFGHLMNYARGIGHLCNVHFIGWPFVPMPKLCFTIHSLTTKQIWLLYPNRIPIICRWLNNNIQLNAYSAPGWHSCIGMRQLQQLNSFGIPTLDGRLCPPSLILPCILTIRQFLRLIYAPSKFALGRSSKVDNSIFSKLFRPCRFNCHFNDGQSREWNDPHANKLISIFAIHVQSI